MDNDIYKPPQSELEPPSTEEKSESEFYVVAVQKFLLLSILTLGIYFIYWFYKNWKNQMMATGEKMLPVMRAIFSIFFTFPLFQRIDSKLQQKETDYVWSATGMAILYIVTSIIGQFTSYMEGSVAMQMTMTLGFFAFSVYALYKAQVAINIACDDPEGATNSAYSGANILWMVVGTAFILLAIFGTYAETAGLLVEPGANY